MNLRRFGKTDMELSEIGFGAWGIGGAYGQVDVKTAIDALARAEELGCNFVDTAGVYGTSEDVLGEFLPGRRDKWFVATKYSGQEEGLLTKAEAQLKTMKIDVIDFYQVHWAPSDEEQELWDALYELKESGKARYVGVSLHWPEDIDSVLEKQQLGGFQIKFSLLDPEPFLSKLEKIRAAGIGIINRSCLREGFLSGKFKGRDETFDDPVRSGYTSEQVKETAEAAEHYRFLEKECGSMAAGAARYCLSYPEVSTLIMGTKTVAQAEQNFEQVANAKVSDGALAKIGEMDGMARAHAVKYARKRKK